MWLSPSSTFLLLFVLAVASQSTIFSPASADPLVSESNDHHPLISSDERSRLDEADDDWNTKRNLDATKRVFRFGRRPSQVFRWGKRGGSPFRYGKRSLDELEVLSRPLVNESRIPFEDAELTMTNMIAGRPLDDDAYERDSRVFRFGKRASRSVRGRQDGARVTRVFRFGKRAGGSLGDYDGYEADEASYPLEEEKRGVFRFGKKKSVGGMWAEDGEMDNDKRIFRYGRSL